MGKLHSLILPIALFASLIGQSTAATKTQLEKYVSEAMVHIAWKKPDAGVVQGSGVVFRIPNYREKFVLTAHHVIEGAIEKKIPIRLQSFGMPKGQGQVTDLEGWQIFHDLASYQLPKKMEKIRPLKLSPKMLRVGDSVGIYSFPLGMPWKSVGRIRGLTPVFVDSPIGEKVVPKYAFSNFVFSGSSGGMMVNEQGQLVGMVTHSISLNAVRRGFSGGLGTPSSLILELVENAVKSGWQPGKNNDKHPFENGNANQLDPFDFELNDNDGE